MPHAPLSEATRRRRQTQVIDGIVIDRGVSVEEAVTFVEHYDYQPVTNFLDTYYEGLETEPSDAADGSNASDDYVQVEGASSFDEVRGMSSSGSVNAPLETLDSDMQCHNSPTPSINHDSHHTHSSRDSYVQSDHGALSANLHSPLRVANMLNESAATNPQGLDDSTLTDNHVPLIPQPGRRDSVMTFAITLSTGARPIYQLYPSRLDHYAYHSRLRGYLDGCRALPHDLVALWPGICQGVKETYKSVKDRLRDVQ